MRETLREALLGWVALENCSDLIEIAKALKLNR
jgi:hypothetical protein